ncbi:hypothetical protein CcCBS67573_g09901 [Chytriomyces confervae]|uniref:OPT superfamily oligopeptide transporter n=1 Tax=Chytriomyces confervae TaxID=246404 RepID=A0A507DKW6_9FUNG|nr:hypothetical protein CcCBS67573_g09901 [Chytriomyces confervae]
MTPSPGLGIPTPWWAFIVTVIIAIVFIIVSGLLSAFTRFSPPFKTFLQLIGGFLLPRKPITNMYFATFGGNVIWEAVAMCTDLKIDQYRKIPPRAVFIAQMYGGVMGALIHWVLNHIILDTKRDILLDPNVDNNWSGQSIIRFNTKAITFGTFAPKLLAAGVGFNYVNMAILSWYFCIFTVGVNSGWLSRIILGFVFQLHLRKYQSTWFNKYTYILAAGLSAGMQLSVFVMSFAFQCAGGVTIDFPFWALNPDPATGDYCTKSK